MSLPVILRALTFPFYYDRRASDLASASMWPGVMVVLTPARGCHGKIVSMLRDDFLFH
jgi:hypothetical protein